MDNSSNNHTGINKPMIADDEIDLRELLTAIWQGKLIFIVITDHGLDFELYT